MKISESNVIFRDFNQSDFEQIESLWFEIGLGSKQRADDANVIMHTLARGGKFIVMESSASEIMGTSWITSDGRRSYLHHFGIKKKYQHKGWGKLLLQKTLHYINEMGLQVKIEVHAENIYAIRLYEKMGFKPLGNYNIYIIRNLNNTNSMGTM